MDDRRTTDELAEYLETTVATIYETRRRNQYPGKLGRREGRRLIFRKGDIDDWLESVPQITRDDTGVVTGWNTDQAYGLGETTNDVNTAILWQLQGIQTTLRAIHNELRAQRSMLAPLVTPSGYIVHEDDESLDKIKEAWERGEKGITMNPARGVVIEDNTFTGEEEE